MSDYIIDQIGAYHQGVAIFSSGKQYGVMLTGGNVLLPPRYDYIAPFNNGYAKAIKGGRCVIIDLSGKEYKAAGEILVPLLSEYDFVRDFHEGLACVRKNYKWGAINLKGEEVISLSYNYLSDFDFGVAKCIKKRDYSQRIYSNDWGFVNSDGEFFDLNSSEPIIGTDGFISFRNNRVFSIDKDGRRNYDQRAHGYIRVDSKGRFALKNGDKTIVLAAQITDYNVVRDFSCGLACVQNKDGYWGVFDTSGNIIVPFEYLSIGDFKENRSVAQNKDGYWGVFDTSGNIIVPFEYLSIEDFKENRSFAKNKSREIILLSEEGRIIKKLEGVTDNESFVHDVAIVFKDDRWGRRKCGLINKVGDLILDFFAGEIIATEDPAIFTLKDTRKKVGYFNFSTGLLVNPKYDEIVKIEKDYLVVNVLDVRGCKSTFDGHPFAFNGNTRVLLPDWCVGGEDFQNGICKAQAADKKWGLVDKDGKTVCEPIYDSIGEIKGNDIIALGRKTITKRGSRPWSKPTDETITTYGLVSIDKKVAIPAKYDKIPVWNGYFYSVFCNGYYGIVDANGILVSEPKYESLDQVGEYFIFKNYRGDLCGLLDKNGKEIISPKYKEIKYIKKGFFKGKTEGKGLDRWYLLNEYGRLSKHAYDEIVLDETGFFRFILGYKEGLLDLEGNIIVRGKNGSFIPVPAQFEWCSDFKDGYATVSYDHRTNYVDEEFNIIINKDKPIHPNVPIDYVVGKDPEGNIICKSGKNIGILSPNGKSIIPAEYESISYLSKNYYVAAKDVSPCKYGVINLDGAVVLPFEYDTIAPFCGSIQKNDACEDECLKLDVKTDNEFWYFSKSGDGKDTPTYFGLIGLSGEILLEAKYEAIQQCAFGFFLKESGKWKAFSKTFSPLGGGMYDSFSEIENGYYLVTIIEKNQSVEQKRVGVLDSGGNEKIAPIYDSIGDFDKGKLPDGLALISKGQPVLYGIINKDYDILLEPQFSEIYDFRNNICAAIKKVHGESIRGIIDSNGNYSDLSTSTQIEEETEIVAALENGLTIIRTIEEHPYYSIKDSSGTVLLPFKYHGIEMLKNGQYKVCGGGYGILDQNFEEILKPTYYSIEESGIYYIVNRFGYGYGVADTSGSILIPCRYRNIKKTLDCLFLLLDDELWGLANEKGEIIVSPKYHGVMNFEDGFACVIGGGHWTRDDEDRSYHYYGGHWGVINSEGNEVIPLIYDSIEYQRSSSLFRVSKTLPYIYHLSEPVFGYINTVGERMVKGVNGDFIKSNPFYEWQEDFIDGVSTIYYSGLKGQVNEHGQFLVHYQVDEEQKETYLPAGFLWGFDSDNELIIVCKDNKKGLYSIAEDRILIEPQYDDLCPLVLHRSADKFYKSIKYFQEEISSSHDGNAQRIGLVKANGETLLSQDYISIEALGHNLISVQREDGQYLVFDTERLTFIPETYDEVYVSKFGDDYRGEERLQGMAIAIVGKNGKYGAINDFGELIIPVEYPSLSLKGSTLLESNGVLLDHLGRVVVSNGLVTVPLIGDYESASLLENNLIVAKQNNLWGVLSLTGQEIIPFIYNSVKAAGTFFIVSRIRLDDETVEYGVIDSRNINIIPFTDVEEITYNKGLFVIRKGNLYGAYSEKGVLVCDASYDKIEILNDFLIKVAQKGWDWYDERNITRWGLFSFVGEEILPCEYKDIALCENKTFVKIEQYDNLIGLLDLTGNMILKPKYFEIGAFEDSYAIVEGPLTIFRKGKEVDVKAYGVIDGAMNEVIPCCFSEIEYEKETGRFKTEEGYKLRDGRFVCFSSGKKILVPSKYMYCEDYVDNRAISVVLCNPGFKFGLIDTSAQDVLPPIFDNLTLFNDGLYRFKLNNLYGIVDCDGKIILDNQYDSIGKLVDGVAIVGIKQRIPYEYEDRKLRGLCGANGEILLPPECDFIGKKTNGYQNIRKNGRWYIYNPETLDQTLVQDVSYLGFCYEGRFLINVGGEFIPGRTKVAIGGKWGLVDANAKIVLSPECDFIGKKINGYQNIRKNGRWYIYNPETLDQTLVQDVSYLGFCHEGRFLINVGGEFTPGKTKVAIGGKWGFVDENAKIVIAPEYERAGRFAKQRAIVKSQGKWGVIDIDGNVIVPFEYDDVFSGYGSKNYCELGVDGTIHVFTIEGQEEKTYPYPESCDADNQYYEPDDRDYEKETWFAMTDGQYGDYPGGNIEYDFLGH